MMLPTMRLLIRAILILVFLPLVALAIYIAAAFGALMLAPEAASSDGEIVLYACDNGVHTDLVLPVNAAGIDWRETFGQQAFTGPVEGLDHIGLGWGGRDFYLNTPTWADVKISTAVQSLLWDETVMRAEYMPAPHARPSCRPWRVDEAVYRQVAAYVRDSLRLSQDRPVQAGLGYGPRDAFFVANGSYTIVDTCNQWSARGLRLAGAPVAPWAPFSFLVTWHLPPANP